MFAGIEVKDKIFIVSFMDNNRNVKGIFKFYKEGLLWFLDHYTPEVIAVNYDFGVSSKLSLTNKAYSNLYRDIIETFEYRQVDKKSFREKEKRIFKSNVEEFWKKIIHKDILPADTPEGLEQRLYNLPKSGIRLNRKLLSQDKKFIGKELDAVVLSFAAYSFYNNRFETIDHEGGIWIIPRYTYVPKKEREQESSQEPA
ncbi:hypothetical protein [Sulfurihydrogenibium subterraneum]|uniref:hypothetical protein n=1 Tax=Sulfurihydrogenibium subterraneum TaxID=171121 RepID=UPI00048F8781|nr:hypothetical protein [Sulfurihydrogenibium subterraneum]